MKGMIVVKADLHMHTTESDGRLSREALFKHAASRGIDLISITDHDTCLSVDDNVQLAKKYGLQYIPGIELSTLYKGKNVHVLGYFTDDSHNNKAMLDYYKMIKRGREERAKQFIENLKKYFDIHITYEQLNTIAHGIIARPHIAKAIIENYPEYSHNEVFDRFIGDHSIAYVPSTELSTEEGIKLLRDHHALVVLAHPKLLKPHIHDDVLMFDFDGIEAIYGTNTEAETTYYRNLADKRGMFVTAGSDFHGIVNDQKHKDVGFVSLTGEDLTRFLTRYETLKKTVSTND